MPSFSDQADDKHIASLLNTDHSQYDQTFQLESYIRELKRTLRVVHLRNLYLTNEEGRIYFKNLQQQTILVSPSDPLFISDIAPKQGTFHEITMTIDPKTYPQLIITPIDEQIRYFKKIISKVIQTDLIDDIYGCFELQKNGNIHFHGLTTIYDNKEQSLILESYMHQFLTNRPYKRESYFKTVQCKPIRDLNNWLTYMRKSPIEFIQHNFVKNTLDL